MEDAELFSLSAAQLERNRATKLKRDAYQVVPAHRPMPDDDSVESARRIQRIRGDCSDVWASSYSNCSSGHDPHSPELNSVISEEDSERSRFLTFPRTRSSISSVRDR